MESQSLPDVVRRDRPDVDSVLSSFNLAEDDGARSVGGGGRPLVKPRENENPAAAAGRSAGVAHVRTLKKWRRARFRPRATCNADLFRVSIWSLDSRLLYYKYK